MDLTRYGFKVVGRAPSVEINDMSDRDIMIVGRKDSDWDKFGLKNGCVEGRFTTTHYDYDENCGWMCSFPEHKHDKDMHLVGFINIGFNTFEEDLEEHKAEDMPENALIRVGMATGHSYCDHGSANCNLRVAPDFEVKGVVKVKDVGAWLKQHYPAFEKAMLKHGEWHKANGFWDR